MTLDGAALNAAAIVVGSLLGLVAGDKLGESFRELAIRATGLVAALIGVEMVFPVSRPVSLLLAVVLGAWIGELWHIDVGWEMLGRWAENKIGRGGFSRGFVTATLIFDIGAMAILGSIQAGTGHTPTILAAKAIMDGITAMVLAATLGWGVMGSAVVTLLHEGSISLLAHQLVAVLSSRAMSDFIAVGGLLVAGIGRNLFASKTMLKVPNLMPAMVLAVGLGWMGLARILPLFSAPPFEILRHRSPRVGNRHGRAGVVIVVNSGVAIVEGGWRGKRRRYAWGAAAARAKAVEGARVVRRPGLSRRWHGGREAALATPWHDARYWGIQVFDHLRGRRATRGRVGNVFVVWSRCDCLGGSRGRLWRLAGHGAAASATGPSDARVIGQ